jgi:FkbM family methyltransferase
LLEPQRNAFRLLESNYANQSQLTFKNVAISDRHETRTLYTVARGNIPEWCQGLASFDRDVVMSHRDLVPGLEHFLETEEVQCITFQSLIEDCRIHHVDLLQVDAEGYDAEIIRLFPFQLIRPGIIHFERKHLSRDELTSSLDRLVSFGYRFANDGAEDLVAY